MAITLDGTTGITTPGLTNTGTETIVNLTTTGNTTLGDATTDTLTVGVTGIVKDASGNVGIGTASPSSILNVKSSAPIFRLETTGTVTSTGTAYNVIRDSTGSDVFVNGFAGLANCYQFATTFSNGFMRFMTGAQAEAMRIDSSGNLLVGTTSAIQSGLISALSAGTAGSFRINSAAGAGIVLDVSRTAATGDMVYFRTSSSTLAGYITCPTGTTTNYLSISDYRLKENIVPMTGALAKISALKPVTYKWKQEFGGTNSQGFIAHELQEVVPDCVVGEKDAVDADGNPKYQGVDTSFLVATLTAAIQEQQALITALTARITALENK